MTSSKTDRRKKDTIQHNKIMENNLITQLEERFERISQKADTCLQLKAILSYHTEHYKSADSGFVFRIGIIAEGMDCMWEAKSKCCEDGEDHYNLVDADNLERHLEELILGVLEDMRTKKIALDNYLNPQALI